MSNSVQPYGLRSAGSFVHGILQVRTLELPCPPPEDLFDPGIEPMSLTSTCIGRCYMQVLWFFYHSVITGLPLTLCLGHSLQLVNRVSGLTLVKTTSLIYCQKVFSPSADCSLSMEVCIREGDMLGFSSFLPPEPPHQPLSPLVSALHCYPLFLILQVLREEEEGSKVRDLERSDLKLHHY